MSRGRTQRLNSISVLRPSMVMPPAGRPIVWTKANALQQMDARPQELPLTVSASTHLANSSRAASNLNFLRNVASSQTSNLASPDPIRAPSRSNSQHTSAANSSASGQHLNNILLPPLVGSIPELTKITSGKESTPGPRQPSMSRDEEEAIVAMKSMRNSSTQEQLKDNNNSRKSQPIGGASVMGSSGMKELDSKFVPLGHPLRGPILLELTIQNILFLLVLLAAWGFGWAPNIRLYFTISYFFSFFYLVQICRLILTIFPNSCAPFYISLIAFTYLIFLSREVRQIIMMFWFIASSVSLLQTGNLSLRFHIPAYTALFLACYGGILPGMEYYYIENCDFVFCDIPLDTNAAIVYYKEVLVACECIFGAIVFFILENFVKVNAAILLEREKIMQHLFIANMDLQRQLRNARTENKVDLEAPLAKATLILSELKENFDIDQSIREEIIFIVGLLSSDKLYQPDLFQKDGDADVHDWLKNMLLTDQAPDGPVVLENNDGTVSVSFGVPTLAALTKVPGMDDTIANICAQSDKYDFDVFDLEIATNGHALYYLGWYMFWKHGFFEKFQISEAAFKNFLLKVESGYRRSNPYHNSSHAADVTQTLHYFVTRPRLSTFLKAEDILSAIVAASVHDFMHPGVNNAFLIATSNALAMRYNDQSVLEHFHVASLFEILSQDEYNFMQKMPNDVRKHLREMVISMVLATDMSQHFDWIGKFKTKVNGTGFNFDTKQDKKLFMNMAIKCSDINNPTKPSVASRRWTQLCMEEFFRQGDEEKLRNLPISPMMNRDNTDIPKCQIGFIEFIVQPLYESFQLYMKEDVEPFVQNVQSNKVFWKACFENPALNIQVPLANFTVLPLNTSPVAPMLSSFVKSPSRLNFNDDPKPNPLDDPPRLPAIHSLKSHGSHGSLILGRTLTSPSGPKESLSVSSVDIRDGRLAPLPQPTTSKSSLERPS